MYHAIITAKTDFMQVSPTDRPARLVTVVWFKEIVEDEKGKIDYHDFSSHVQIRRDDGSVFLVNGHYFSNFEDAYHEMHTRSL